MPRPNKSNYSERQQRPEVSHDSLLAYGRRYCLRYQPATDKLRQQLLHKAGSETPVSVIDAVLTELAPLMDDDRRAQELIDQMRAKGRNASYIQGKLRQRQFSADTIKRGLNHSVEDGASLWLPDALTRKIDQLLRKGQSRAIIRRTLVERAADAPLVDAALNAQLPDTGDEPALAAALTRLRRSNLDDRTLIRRLQAKGFPYQAIKKALQAED